MPHELFRPHGQYQAVVEGLFLIATVSGSWNIEMHQECGRQSQPLVEQLEATGKPWGSIVILTDTMVSSLDVIKAGRQVVAENKGRSRLLALAWVIAPDVEGYALLLPTYRAMYEGLLVSAVFPSVEPAKVWLAEVLRAAEA